MNNQKILTKRQYLDLNRPNFVGLTSAQLDIKYSKYKQKYKSKDRSEKIAATNKNRQIVPYKGNTAKNSNNVSNNRKRGFKTVMPNNKMEFKLSKCLLSYARASIDPFDNITDMPCIPDSLTVPSYKFRTYLEADVTVGAAGTGFAIMNPYHMIFNNNLVVGTYSDYPVLTTNTGYLNPGYLWTTLMIGAGIGLNAYNPQSPLVIDPNVKYRLVAAGMELDYTGVLLNQSGLVSVIQWDGLDSLPNPNTIPIIRQHPRCQTCPTSREARCYVRYEPARSEDFSYHNVNYYYPHTLGDIPGYYPMGIFVSGATSGTTFRVRAVAFFEVQSTNLPATPSESDAVGFPAFQAARSAHLPTPDPQTDLWTILKNTASNILTSVSGFAPVIGGAIGSIFGQPMLGTAVGGLSKDLIQSVFGA
jgi:hypothetical protein